VLLLLLVGLFVLPIVLTRSALVKLVVLPRIEAELGAEVSASRVIIEPDASIVASDLVIRIPGLSGPASQLLTAERVEIASSWSDLLSGSGEFREMVLTRPTLRVSRDTETGEINLGRLRSPDGGPPASAAPRVIVRQGSVELGEQTGEKYSALRTLRVEGSATPTPGAGGVGYELAFREGAVSDAEGRGLGLTGRITPAGIEFALEGLDFSQWRPENIPSDFREVFGLMNIEGGVPSASMHVAADGSTKGVVQLDGVSLNLPFDTEGKAADPDRLVRLRDVTGRVEVSDSGAEAFLDGMLGDLPTTVWLRYDGLQDDSAFQCEVQISGFELSSDPEIMPLAPAIVVKRLHDFSNPTMTIDASVVAQRGPPTEAGPAPIKLRGDLTFHDGAATFRDFPYPFTGLTGLAHFDEEKIDLVRVDGVAASGARLHAEGRIAPPLPGAGVHLLITVEGVPIDQPLLDALGERRRGIVEALCSREKFDRLREAGLLPAHGAADQFVLGGVASVEIDIVREIGEESEYTEEITVRLPRVGLVPEPFPLPIIASDLVIHIKHGEARIVGGSFTGLGGGRAEVQATVDLSKPDEQGVQITIEATEVPTDELLLAALPGGLEPAQDGRSPSAILRRLGVAGSIGCDARIGPRDGGEMGYDIRVGFDGLSASPAHGTGLGAPPVALQGLAGQLIVSEREMTLGVNAQVWGAKAATTQGELTLDTRLRFDADDRRPFTAEVRARIDDVTLALEDLVSVVAPEMAGRLTEIRRERHPTGGVTLTALASGDAAGEGALDRLDITVSACDGLAFDHEAGRLGATAAAGSLAFSALAPEVVAFDGWAGVVSLDAEPVGAVTISGDAPLGRGWRGGDALDLGLRDARMESPLVRRAALGAMSPTLGAAFERAAMTGRFDADLRLVGQAGADRPLATGQLRPRSCELTIAGQRVVMSSIAGGITLDEIGGSFDACRAEGEGWWAEVSGDWVTTAGAGPGAGSVLLECELAGESRNGLTPEVRALLPGALRGAIDAVSITADGPIAAEEVKLRLSLGDGASPASSGRVVFAGAAADIGVRVTGASGYLDFESGSVPGAGMASFGVGIVLDAAQAAGVNLTDGMVRVTSDPLSGTVLVPVILADAYAGRLSGAAIVQPGEAGRASYEAEFRLSGVPLGELLADWEHAAGIERAAETEQSAPQRPEAESRGLVDAGLTVAGVAGDTGSRRGRGSIIVGGGDGAPVMRLPLLLPLIEVSNLQVPSNDPLDFGEAVFYLDGDRVVFERIGVFARSVEIFGYGQMTLPGMDLDLRFSSRAADRLPVISDILERFRDELITTRVRGTVSRPELSAEQFARTRRLLTGAVGGKMSEEERRMVQIERLSRESERREWRVPRDDRDRALGNRGGPQR
jgi:hypothetical protein